MTAPLLQTPPLSVLDSLHQPVDVMIGEVAALIGGADDHIARSKALIWLDRAADRLNMAGILLYNRREKVYSEATVSFDQASSFELPPDWGWPTDPIALYSGTSLVGYAQWLSWDQFQRFLTGTQFAAPRYFSLRSDLADGRVYFHPYVNGDSITEIRLAYLARVQRPSEHPELTLWPETREALIAGGEFFAMRYRHAQAPNIWRPFEDNFMRSIEGAKAAAARWIEATHPAAVPDLDGWTIPGIDSGRYVFPGPGYILLE